MPLSTCVKEPDALFEVFSNRIKNTSEAESGSIPIDSFEYRFLFISNEDNSLHTIHPSQEEQNYGKINDWLLILSFLQKNGSGIISDQVLENEIGQYWDSNESRIEVDRVGNKLNFIQKRLSDKTEASIYLHALLKRVHKDRPDIPNFIKEKVETELEPCLTESKKSFPFDEFLYECVYSAQLSIAFLHVIFNRFIDYIIDNFKYTQPDDLLFHSLYYASPTSLKSEQLLSVIRAHYPDYSFHSSINTKHYDSMIEWKNLYKPSIVKPTKEVIKIISANQHISFKSTDIPKELARAIYLLGTFDFFQFSVNEKVDNKIDASIQLLSLHEVFGSQWNGDIEVTELTEFSLNNIRNFRAKLKEVFFNSYRPVPEVFKEEFLEKLIHLIFKGGLNCNWIIFKSSVNNDYFYDECLMEYFWIAFNEETLDVVIIAGFDAL